MGRGASRGFLTILFAAVSRPRSSCKFLEFADSLIFYDRLWRMSILLQRDLSFWGLRCIYRLSYIPVMTRQFSSAAAILEKILVANPNIEDVKEMVRETIVVRETKAYHAMSSSEQTYLQVQGLADHEEETFNFLNQLLHERTTDVLRKISESELQLRSTTAVPSPEPQVPNAELLAEVEAVLDRVDLPVDMFQKGDGYWTGNNPRTLQAKEYLKQLHEQDRKWKDSFKKKRDFILNDRNEQLHSQNERNAKRAEKEKQELRQRALHKIEFLKGQVEQRRKSIEKSKEFMKEQGKPMFKKIEEVFMNQVELPSLEEKKRKLSQLRELRRSVDLQEIAQHRQKYERTVAEHQRIRIFDEPVQVSFKSHFYHEQSPQSTEDGVDPLSLHRKKIQYAEIVKSHYRPTVSAKLAQQVQQRIEQSKKRRVRVNRPQRIEKDEDEEEEEQKEPSPPPTPDEPEEEEENDSEEEENAGRKKDDQVDPDWRQRYQMGVNYLQHAKNARRRTLSSVGPPQEEEKPKRPQYRDYLHERQTNKTIDWLDTSRIQKTGMSEEEQTRSIARLQERARREQELMRFGKAPVIDRMNRKLELDGAVVQAIKARLALMNK